MLCTNLWWSAIGRHLQVGNRGTVFPSQSLGTGSSWLQPNLSQGAQHFPRAGVMLATAGRVNILLHALLQLALLSSDSEDLPVCMAILYFSSLLLFVVFF